MRRCPDSRGKKRENGNHVQTCNRGSNVCVCVCVCVSVCVCRERERERERGNDVGNTKEEDSSGEKLKKRKKTLNNIKAEFQIRSFTF